MVQVQAPSRLHVLSASFGKSMDTVAPVTVRYLDNGSRDQVQLDAINRIEGSVLTEPLQSVQIGCFVTVGVGGAGREAVVVATSSSPPGPSATRKRRRELDLG